MAGLVATNTTISRAGLTTPETRVKEIGAGGLSGAPLTNRSTEVIRYLHTKSDGKIPMIAVGGIMTPKMLSRSQCRGQPDPALYRLRLRRPRPGPRNPPPTGR